MIGIIIVNPIPIPIQAENVNSNIKRLSEKLERKVPPHNIAPPIKIGNHGLFVHIITKGPIHKVALSTTIIVGITIIIEFMDTGLYSFNILQT